MFEYIFLIGLALIVIPIVYVLSAKRKTKSSVVAMTIIGLFIALIATFIDEHFSFYYTILVMFGLAFALSILLDKRQERKVVAQESPKEEVVDDVVEESELQRFIKEEAAAAAVVEEEIVIDKSTDDDLEMWMSDTLSDAIIPNEEESRSEK